MVAAPGAVLTILLSVVDRDRSSTWAKRLGAGVDRPVTLNGPFADSRRPFRTTRRPADDLRGMEVSAFQPSAANISAVSSDGNRGEPDGREHERALVARAKDGDRDAFGALYRQHAAAVSRVVRFRLGRDDEDAVSEVFLRAWRGLATYRDTGVPFAAGCTGSPGTFPSTPCARPSGRSRVQSCLMPRW